ncbi:MAG TPA: trimeric intracellular cation channel family protein, partial [Chondromyces sp.]|nr:trimeric intracellular cation channel family protein [Chondromyces sp.]
GTIAFAISGAIVAIEEEYSILGVYTLGIVTAFGGGAVQNLFIGVPVNVFLEQELLFHTVLFVVTIVLLFSHSSLKHWHKWGNFMDAIGFAAFAIHGALYAVNMGHTTSTIIVAAVLAGSAGGIIRDVLGGRKPLILQTGMYACWAMLAGLIVSFKVIEHPIELYILFVGIVVFCALSYTYNWRLPNRILSSPSNE